MKDKVSLNKSVKSFLILNGITCLACIMLFLISAIKGSLFFMYSIPLIAFIIYTSYMLLKNRENSVFCSYHQSIMTLLYINTYLPIYVLLWKLSYIYVVGAVVCFILSILFIYFIWYFSKSEEIKEFMPEKVRDHKDWESLVVSILYVLYGGGALGSYLNIVQEFLF